MEKALIYVVILSSLYRFVEWFFIGIAYCRSVEQGNAAIKNKGSIWLASNLVYFSVYFVLWYYRDLFKHF